MVIRGHSGFIVPDVEVATGFRRRWRGLMGRAPRPLLLATSSVHGFWLSHPLWVVAISADLEVMRGELLRPWRVLTVPGAAWILELPAESQLPVEGEGLTFEAGNGEADADGRTALPVRDPDREPG